MAVVHGLAVVLLLGSGIAVIGKLLGLIVLIIQLSRVWKNPTPEPRYTKLEYLNKQWFLTANEDKTSQEAKVLIFTRHRVLIEAGLFFLLHLSSDKSQKTIVIFFDQILADDYRVLRILQKIN